MLRIMIVGKDRAAAVKDPQSDPGFYRIKAGYNDAAGSG